ncbi:hypothetical protein BDY17DRAFT_325539 [Neohortaea acidophila]|uniref:SET domain-containing protein n=1 Tax=Neohortaea acidophila TaxID=245834 RepID=A0A6A6PRF7_9PEZI|nr:uncharacterized protein BDY17DRAFT_325539 [Neohortaea acidophila]KAF2482043.1 hypothetical protein BDY17DRAFT_325539 [Neohortaea acidophila]
MASKYYANCMENLAYDKKVLEAAEKRKGQKRRNKPTRLDLELNHQVFRGLRQESQIRRYRSYHEYPPSTTPMASLQPISISDLRLETHHCGRVLFVHTFGNPVLCMAIRNIVEDVNGDVEQLAVYNTPKTATLKHVLPGNCVFAIKEPFYEASEDGLYAIRVDHPSDLVQLQVTDALFPQKFLPQITEPDKSAIEYKVAGNAAFRRKDYLLARHLYTQALQLSGPADELTQILLRNRGVANFNLGRYEEAETDARASIVASTDMTDSKKVSLDSKALYCAGRAAYELRKYQEADEAFLSALKLTPNDPDTMREHNRCSRRLYEQSGGDYDFEQMSQSATKTHRLDHADFTSNVAVRSAGKRGRGLFACKDIKAGELILCEKAFQACFASECNASLLGEINTERGYFDAAEGLVFDTIDKVRRNPEAASRYLELDDGGYQPKCPPTLVDNTTVVDSFLVRAIILQNCFKCHNVRSSDHYCYVTPGSPDVEARSAGIWIASSYINHACVGNAFHSFMGDMRIVRAVRDIARDEEILVPYRCTDIDHNDVRKILKDIQGFECDCIACVAETKTPDAQRAHRTKLITDITAFMSAQLDRPGLPNKHHINRGKQLYRDLEKTYDGDNYKNVPRLGMIVLGSWLCGIQRTFVCAKETVHAAKAVMSHAGFHVEVKQGALVVQRTNACLDPCVTGIVVIAAHAYVQLGEIGIAEQFMVWAREMHVTVCGELRGFDKLYPKLAV